MLASNRRSSSQITNSPSAPAAIASITVSVTSCPNDAAPPGAEREPHGDLAPPPRDAETGEQRADVRARDQQDEHRKHQGDHGAGRGLLIGTRGRKVVVAEQRDDVGKRGRGPRHRRLLLRPCGNHRHGQYRLIGAHTGRQARREAKAGVVVTSERRGRALHLRTRVERKPDAHLRAARPRAGESARCDADDRDRDAVDFHLAADHVRRALEVSLPQRVADHGDERRRRIGVVRVNRETRADCRAKTQHLEILAGDVGRSATLRVRLAPADVEDDIGRRPRGDVAEQRPRAAYSKYSGYENSRPIARPGRARSMPRIRTSDSCRGIPGTGPLTNDWTNREQRRTEADAEREDADHRRGDNRRAREVARREAKILNRVLDHAHAPHVPARFL